MDYSDEGSSSSSDNEGKGSNKDFSDLEGPCCHPLRAPPCSPELDVEIRKLRYSRMRKIMQTLDRIYFQPLFHKKLRFLLKTKRSNIKKRKRKLNQKSLNESEIQNSDMVNKISLQYVKHLENNKSSTSIQTLRPQDQIIDKQAKHSNKKRLKSVAQDLAKKPVVKVSRKLRLWLQKRQIFIIRRKMFIARDTNIRHRCHRRRRLSTFTANLLPAGMKINNREKTHNKYCILLIKIA
ncbi:hypothetical protein FF38_13833 [Lucilia cuprina]|uniref:Uncharacterized protein n=1 Tax=Lucilia cuprina TaxID=7375 RepID=A0A0L0BUR6_LUCCU|nr:hypothetical protein FF38_13833 [Lucilia cuprina]